MMPTSGTRNRAAFLLTAAWLATGCHLSPRHHRPPSGDPTRSGPPTAPGVPPPPAKPGDYVAPLGFATTQTLLPQLHSVVEGTVVDIRFEMDDCWGPRTIVTL